MGGNRSPLALGLFAQLVLPLTFLGLFFFYPLFNIARQTFSGAILLEVWSESSTWEVAWFTFWQACLSALLTFVAALPMAYVLGRMKFKGKSFLSAVLVVPFVLPTLVVAVAMLSLQDRLGLRGFLDQSVWAILLAHVFFNYALVARIVGGFWARLDSRLELVAKVSGASKWRTFFTITLPGLKPAILTSLGLVFFFSFTSFGVILILGGPTKATLDTEIWRFATQRLEFDTAAALTLLQILVVAAMAYFNNRTSRHTPGISTGVESLRRPRAWQDRGALGLALGISGLLLFLPLALMVWESFAPRGDGGVGLSSYRTLFNPDDQGSRVITIFVEPLSAIYNSLTYAVTAMVIATFLGTLAAYAIFNLRSHWVKKILEPLFLVPLGVSAVALGFGFLVALDSPPLDLRTSWLIVPLAHALIGLPFVLRPVLSRLESIDPRLRWSANSLGANRLWTFWKVDLPLISGAILTGAGFCFAISLGEFGAASFLARPDRPTIPLTIFQLLSNPGALSYGQAMALSTILMALVAGAILLIDRIPLFKSTRDSSVGGLETQIL